MLVRSKYIQYYVEGEDEKKIIDTLKTDLKVIKPGKVQKLNVVLQEIRDMHLRPLQPGTMVVLVFDTDAGNPDILQKNIKKLEAYRSISEIVLIPQVPNLEGELLRSCDIKKIEELLNSKSKKEFKSDLIRVTNLDKKLKEHQFDIKRFWCGTPMSSYQNIENQAVKIKLAE